MAQPEGYVEKTRTSSGGEKYQYVYQYVDHLGNIRVSYTDNVDREEVSSTSTFDSGLQGWSNAEADQVVVENGRLKITAPSKWRGAHITTNNVAGRDKATLQLDVDMATTHKILVTLWQYRADGSYITRYGEYITQSGTHRIDSNIDPEAATFRIKVEKSYTPEDDGIATDFYIDNVLLLHQIVGLTIVEENNYYPFGLKHKGYNGMINGRSHQYKYNNTELEEGLGLNWYEMPLRSYDPTTARWNRQDPVVHHGLSTYNAFDNNPIVYADPSGADSESPWNHDNRENTLDSGGRGSFGFSSYIARNTSNSNSSGGSGGTTSFDTLMTLFNNSSADGVTNWYNNRGGWMQSAHGYVGLYGSGFMSHADYKAYGGMTQLNEVSVIVGNTASYANAALDIVGQIRSLGDNAQYASFGSRASAIGDLRGWDKLFAEAQENIPLLFGRRKSDDGKFYVDPAGNPMGIVPIGAPVNLPFGPKGVSAAGTIIKSVARKQISYFQIEVQQ